MTKDPRVYLAHITECIDRIQEYTTQGREAFFVSRLTQDAVVRNLEIIGEAARRVPESYRQAHPHIPWREMAGLRDVLIHDYEGVDISRVWLVIENELPLVRANLAALLPPLDQLEAELSDDID
jgi:uncharacterized protein with HEPN domain